MREQNESNQQPTPQVLTVAGSDSGGCAGVQADLKSFQARHAFGMNVFVALTAQNTLDVQDALPVPTDFIDQQFASLAADYAIRAVKTGMLSDSERVECVAANLKRYDFGPLVVDPVMVAKGGHPLLADSAVESVRKDLLPLARVVTPNIPEAEALSGRTIHSQADMVDAAKAIQDLGAACVIVKGGHLADIQADQSADLVLLPDGRRFWMSAPRINTKNTHGTGDTFSAVIAAELAKGTDLAEAIKIGKRFIQGAIADGISVGHGHGPVNHWAALATDVHFSQVE